MGAPQFFAEPADLTADIAVLRGDEARHAASVLRVQAGELLVVADGRGRVAQARATAVGPGEVRASVLALRHVAQPVPAITVVVGLLKTGKLDLVMQKLTELGVERVAPAACARSVVRWDARKAAGARERWAAIARAAAKQAHRARIPEVLPVASLADQVRACAAGGPVLVCWEGSKQPLAAALDDAARGAAKGAAGAGGQAGAGGAEHGGGPKAGPESVPESVPGALTVVVGPEGGLEDGEVEACRAAGAVDVSLGSLVLRAETAALAATACVGYHYGLLGGAPASG
jgi:16S rRNA (uracil1498-N3)-methyltransferase